MTADLVGQKAAAGLHGDQPLTVRLTREVVASALGLRESALDAASDGQLRTAASRLRRIAETILADIRRDVVQRTRGSSISVGAAQVKSGDKAERVLVRADDALYRERKAARRTQAG